MYISFKHALWYNFLGKSPDWLKFVIVIFLIINPLFFLFNAFLTGWILIIEFIFVLAMALKCYPLLPGGLLAIEAILIGLTNQEHVKKELLNNIEVILLLIFMVASIHFMKQLLLFIFTRLLLSINSKKLLSLVFCSTTAFLSAFLDAMTVIAVVISVAISFYEIYHKIVYVKTNVQVKYKNRVNYHDQEVTEQFCKFLRSLMMHASIGTSLGGVMTMVGEPQNLIIAKTVGWNFNEFFLRISPVSLPVFIFGLFICWLVEKFSWFDYGAKLPSQVRDALQNFYNKIHYQRSKKDIALLVSQSFIGIWLILALALHIAEAYLIGLSVIILATTFTGVTDECSIGKAFIEVLPFTVLLVIFFTMMAVITDQKLFTPIMKYILQAPHNTQPLLFYIFNGLLSSISDNVFVGTIYIKEASVALARNIISLEQFKLLAVSINTGTNLPSVATPNGQAAFLFLLTSSLAPLIHLSYSRMVWMALPYTTGLTLIGFLCIKIILEPVTQWIFH